MECCRSPGDGAAVTPLCYRSLPLLENAGRLSEGNVVCSAIYI